MSVGHCQARSAARGVLRHAWYTAGGAEKKVLFLMQYPGALTFDMHLFFHKIPRRGATCFSWQRNTRLPCKGNSLFLLLCPVR